MLTDLALTKTKPDPEKEIRLADGEGLHLAILPNGRRFWRWDYTYEGRRKQLSFGKYPRVTLKMARTKKEAAQVLLDAGTDPSLARKQEKLGRQQQESAPDQASFLAVAEEWIERAAHTNHPSTIQKKRALLKTYLVPTLGARPIASIRPGPDLLPLLRAVERLGRIETAHRVRQMASEIFRYAIITDRGETDPAALLAGALKPVTVRHHPTLIDPPAVAELLNAIDHADGLAPTIVAALRLAPLLFVRPGELRNARWTEFNLDAAMWRIPATRMKPTATRIDHLVPLSTQALTILRELKTITGENTLVFPGLKQTTRPISDATLATVLRRLGYSREQQSVHGFRTLASTHLREIGFENDLVELQLSHKIANPVRAAYDKAARVPERVKMMQAYADHLDNVKAGRVVSFTARVLEMPQRQETSAV